MGTENKLLEDIRALLSSSNDKEINSLGLQASPELAAVISKLTRPVNQEDETLMNGSFLDGSMFSGINEISKQQMGRKENAYNAFKLFPDLELAAQILVTSIISPKDMLTAKLNYRLEDSPLPVAASSEILDLIRGEMTTTYKLDESLYDIIHEALFSSGSYPFIVIPESAVDMMINEGKVLSVESAQQSGLFTNKQASTVKALGILGDPHSEGGPEDKLSLERAFIPNKAVVGYNETLYIGNIDYEPSKEDIFTIEGLTELARAHTTVTDNYDILKLPEMIDAAASAKMASIIKNPLHLATESAETKVSAGRLFEMLYKKAPSSYVPFSSMPTSLQLKRRNIGRPALLKPGCEAVIPIFLPGEYDNHMGYFLVTDVDGNPVSIDSTVNEFAQGMSSMGIQDRTGASSSNLLTDRAKRNLVSDNWVPQVQKMSEIYAQVVEKDLLERLSRGIMGKKNVDIKISSELSRTMLARAWRGRATRIVFVPGEYVTYFAYDYHRNGVGKSYLDDLANVIGLRAMVLFSSVWARVRSSISTIATHVTLDPRDTDPVKTIEMVKHLVAKSRQQYFPNGLQSVQDFTDWLHNAGIQVTWEGHPGLPTTSISSESKNIDHVQPDDALAEQLKDMCYTRFGVTKEMVDGAASSDFAATVESHTVLFARRTKVLGQTTSKHTTHLVQTLLTFDESIQRRIIEILNRNQEAILSDMTDEDKEIFNESYVTFTKMMLQDIVSRVRAELPEPDATKISNTKDKLTAYEEVLDIVLEYIYSEKFLTGEVAGDLSDYVVPLKEAWKAELMRRYISNNDILPEVFDIISLDETGKPSIRLNELVDDHVAKLMLSSVDLLNKMKKYRDKANADIEKSGTEEPTSEDNGFGDGSNTEDEFGMEGDDLETTPTEEPPVDEAPIEEPPETKPEEPSNTEEPTEEK